MIIRTKDEFQDLVYKETSWRKRELSILASKVQLAKEKQVDTEIRAGIALLYAHWEGLVKNLATYYLCYVSCQKCRYNEIKPNFMAVAVSDEIKEFADSNKSSLHNAILLKIREDSNKVSNIPYENIIKTNSNLKSDIFIEIMETIGLDYDEYEPSFKMIDEVLLKSRNSIAHGEYLNLDKTRFEEVYEVMRGLMNMFASQILNAVILGSSGVIVDENHPHPQ